MVAVAPRAAVNVVFPVAVQTNVAVPNLFRVTRWCEVRPSLRTAVTTSDVPAKAGRPATDAFTVIWYFLPYVNAVGEELRVSVGIERTGTVGVGAIVGVTLGVGVGVTDGVGVVLGEGVAEGVGDVLGVGVAEGVGVIEVVGVDVGVGVGVGVTAGWHPLAHNA